MLNQDLDKLASHCRSIYIESDYGDISIEDFKRQLNSKTSEKPNGCLSESSSLKMKEDKLNFFDFIEQEMSDMEAANMKNANMKKSSFKTYRVHANLLKEFAIEYNPKNLFTYEDGDWNFRLKLID